MKKYLKKVLSGAASVTMLASQAVMAENVEVGAETVAYDEIANVQGKFSFDQVTLSPSDEVFSLFGTAATGICAKPAFAMEETDAAEKYFINVSGMLKKAYTTTLAELKSKGGESKTMVCSCSMGPAMAQAAVTGAPVSEMLQLAGIAEEANTIAFRSKDGYTSVLPLKYALDNEAMLVWQVAGKENPAGLQVWMPSTAAKYFTRQVTDIEVYHSDEEIKVDRIENAKVSILNHMDETVAVGDELVFSGYADDCGTSIAAVEFSLDGGKTWTTCRTKDARADRWVAWNFAYTAEKIGDYKLDVRAVAANGDVSPLASSVTFSVV